MEKKLFIIPCFLILFSAQAQEKLPHVLLVGDYATVLPLDKWIKGGPLNIYDKRKVYLIDFWAVWCGPCIAGMEHLSSLQKKYKDKGLEVIGATSEDAWGNSYDKVVSFIKSKDQKFDYNFAWLPQSYNAAHEYRSIIYNPWLEKAYDSSTWALPQVFLIDRNGKIAFIGDGYTLTEDYLVKVLNGTYDISDERKIYIERIRVENEVNEFLTLLSDKNVSEAETLGNSIVNNPNVTAHALLVMCDNIFNKYKDVQTPALLNIALIAAKKGVTLTGSRSPSQLATLAKAYSLLNRPQEAVETLQTAISLAEGDFKEALQKDLVVYEEQLKNKTAN